MPAPAAAAEHSSGGMDAPAPAAAAEDGSSDRALLPELPPEVLSMVLERLPPDALHACCRVSKAWHAQLQPHCPTNITTSGQGRYSDADGVRPEAIAACRTWRLSAGRGSATSRKRARLLLAGNGALLPVCCACIEAGANNVRVNLCAGCRPAGSTTGPCATVNAATATTRCTSCPCRRSLLYAAWCCATWSRPTWRC